MKDFIEFIGHLEFIGGGGGPTPPTEVTWDNATPWDNDTYWI